MNLIFDFDGTICDSFDITLQIANEYLRKFKKKTVNPSELREKGIEEIIREYRLSKLQILVYIFKGRREAANHITQLETFPGMKAVIQEFSKGHTLGIVSF